MEWASSVNATNGRRSSWYNSIVYNVHAWFSWWSASSFLPHVSMPSILNAWFHSCNNTQFVNLHFSFNVIVLQSGPWSSHSFIVDWNCIFLSTNIADLHSNSSLCSVKSRPTTLQPLHPSSPPDQNHRLPAPIASQPTNKKLQSGDFFYWKQQCVIRIEACVTLKAL